MSENIVIQEGGVAKQMTVDKLKVNKVGGGTCLYVPEESVSLGTKSVTENGTYKAENDGYVGYSQVYVNVSGGGGGGGDSIVGRDSDGNEVIATKDPDTDAIVITKIPSSIVVITPPTNPYGTYIDGQTITKDGMVVKAYDATGNEMQNVPTGETTITPTVAVYDEGTDSKGKRASISDSVLAHPEYINQPLITTSDASIETTRPNPESPPNNEIDISTDAEYMLCYRIGDGPWLFAAFSESPGHSIEAINFIRGTQIDVTSTGCATTCITRASGKTVYYGVYTSWLQPLDTYTNTATVNIMSNIDIADIATVLFDGNISPAGSPQTITVSWPRPGDGKQLETTFDINVGPRAGQGDD